MTLRRLLPAAVAALALGSAATADTLTFELLDSVQPGGAVGEVVDWLPSGNLVVATIGDQGAWGAVFNGSFEEVREVDLASLVEEFEEVTGLATDPSGRGLKAVGIVRERGTVGQVALVPVEGEPTFVDVGHHPDCVRFCPNGKFVLVACEGEYPKEGGEDFAGSLAVIELDEAGQPVATDVYDFSAANLAEGVSLEGLRNQAGDQAIENSVEPEYVAVHDGVAWVSLQEANALAVFDLEQRQWTMMAPLGTIEQTIDADKKDGEAIIDDLVAGLPMPDTIVTFEHDGRVLIASANEGDARPDDGDLAEIGDGAELDESVDAAPLEGLEISAIDGDSDDDGDIDVPTMFGTRSWTLWTPTEDGLERVWDSGSLEEVVAECDPDMHNVNRDEFEVDDRSDDKGPEPEALATGVIDGKRHVFVGLERQNGILAYCLLDGGEPQLVGYLNEGREGRVSPETLVFVSAEQSPTDNALLLVGFEGGDDTPGSVAVYGLGLGE